MKNYTEITVAHCERKQKDGEKNKQHFYYVWIYYCAFKVVGSAQTLKKTRFISKKWSEQQYYYLNH